jgi:glyoxylase-like metal-dependent hydrolase (beta-lactamase superfamily II)
MAAEPQVHNVFEPNTGTWQYIIADPASKAAVIIDPVLDFNSGTNELSSKSADNLLSIVRENGYEVRAILETHVHADHITAAKYLQRKLEEKQTKKPSIGIGKRVSQVQERFGQRYGIPASDYSGAFDKLFDDNEEFQIGDLQGKVLHLPGHTPDHLGYQIGGKLIDWLILPRPFMCNHSHTNPRQILFQSKRILRRLPLQPRCRIGTL